MKSPISRALLAALTLTGLRAAPAHASCSAPANAIEAENCLPGNPESEWDIPLSEEDGETNSGDPDLQGFPTAQSVNVGGTISFKVNSTAAYTMNIYRMGYYDGLGARLVATIGPISPQAQPACDYDPTTGLTDCGNWAVSASWAVPATATSGIYFVHNVRQDTGGSSHMFFVVRNDASHSALFFQTSDTTEQAYNRYGGSSLYYGPPASDGGSYKVSYNRPETNRDYTDNEPFTHEYPMVRFLEANAYDMTYTSGVDSDLNGSLILNHKVFLSVGHDEYWSAAQRANVTAARAAGIHLAFFSGNTLYWKTRWENSIDGTNTSHRTLVCYKETYHGRIDPQDPPTWTGMWRDQSATPPDDAKAQENELKGTFYTVDAYRQDTLTVGSQDGQLRFWRNTGAAKLAPGATAGYREILGYEWDEDIDNGSRPAGLMDMSSSTFSVPEREVGGAFMTSYVSGSATHRLSLYRSSSGALVFGAGTMQWSWGLDSHHDQGSNYPPEPDLQQATVNLLADMGVQPAKMIPGLVPAAQSTDHTPPVSQVLTPAQAYPAGTVVTISGTAVDSGGVVAAVEVSTDNGVHWHPAQGRGSWTYTWTQLTAATVSAMSRAVDDSGNLEGGAASGPPPGNPVPSVASLSPASELEGGAGFTLTATGSGFISGATALWNGQALATTFVSATQLKAAIPAADLAAAGTAAVSVVNPAPGGGTSNAAVFTIAANNPVPAVASLIPSSATVGSPGFTLAVEGANFIKSSTVLWSGANRATVFISSTALNAAIPASDLASPGIAAVAVLNPAPGGGTSNPGAVLVKPVEAEPGQAGDPGQAKVYPNPWRADQDGQVNVTINGVAPQSEIRFFTVSGHWVKTVLAPSGSGAWDLTNDAGQGVASGLYLYVISQPDGGQIRGTLSVIK
jgi:hypothetical protein